MAPRRRSPSEVEQLPQLRDAILDQLLSGVAEVPHGIQRVGQRGRNPSCFAAFGSLLAEPDLPIPFDLSFERAAFRFDDELLPPDPRVTERGYDSPLVIRYSQP